MKIKAKCSNCGKKNEYDEKNWQGRENTICMKCNSPLSPASSWWLGPKESEELRKIADDS